MKRITKKPGFGKKTIGWGLSPIKWQGWMVTIVFILVVILNFYVKVNVASIVIFILALIVFIAIALLTGEKPGSKQFDKEEKL